MSRDLLKAQIVDTFRRASVRQVEIGGLKLYVRGLTGGERIQLQQMAAEAQQGGEPLADFKVAVLGLCDESGARLFEDAKDLANLDGAVLAEISKHIIEASGLGEAARDIAAKN